MFKRVERDEEFRNRCFAITGIWGTQALKFLVDGKALDDVAWDELKMQRRLIDDYA